ncbi:oxidoreductase-like protein [Phyllosticta citribraziliensis]|uniref:Oxidoreductase-like protein n=1 Tax=Phyllosticta citribraziliensis TaxID=989973 RepID=A0ABR1LL72_9PEZI
MALVAVNFSEGERRIQRLMNPSLREMDNPTAPTLTHQAAFALNNFPLIALGALDSQNRPWTTLLGGSPPLAQPLGDSLVGVQAKVNAESDPVIEALFDGKQRQEKGQVTRDDAPGKMIGGLPINLDTRKRVKVFGRLVARKLLQDTEDERVGNVQLFFNVEQSLGNCPKYLNSKQIVPATPSPHVVSTGSILSPEARELIQKSDLFFISSSNSTTDMDTNHRGGPPGFVRITQSKDSETATIVYPEYSGNRLYQTLGNLQSTPRAGICFPDFETGDVLYLTGITETLAGAAAAAVLPRSNLAVRITVTASRFVRQGLSFRGIPGERSPYNPPVRPLASESSVSATLANLGPAGVQAGVDSNSATLTAAELLAPTIGRFTFSLDRPALIQPGQWVALDFSEELDIGYSHMRDDEPQSLNDDFVRTFTVSSAPRLILPSPSHSDSTSPSPAASPVNVAPSTTFTITVRLIPNGPATSFLFKHIPRSPGRRSALRPLSLPVRGFGGSFSLLPITSPHSPPQQHPPPTSKSTSNNIIPFVAAGVGITPLLGQLSALEASTHSANPPRQHNTNTAVHLFWTLRRADAPFARALLRAWRHDPAAQRVWGRVALFLTGGADAAGTDDAAVVQELEALGAAIVTRRMAREDLLGGASGRDGDGSGINGGSRWFVCAGRGFREEVRAWLEAEGCEVVSEEFDF